MLYPYPYDETDDEETMNTSSAADCTGLIPSAAIDEDEFFNYNELYDFLPHAAENDRKCGG